MKKLLIAAVLFFMVSFAHAQATIEIVNNVWYPAELSIYDNTTSTDVYLGDYPANYAYCDITDGDDYTVQVLYDGYGDVNVELSLAGGVGGTIASDTGTDGAYFDSVINDGDSIYLSD